MVFLNDFSEVKKPALQAPKPDKRLIKLMNSGFGNQGSKRVKICWVCDAK
jgi:hypothetical protein